MLAILADFLGWHREGHVSTGGGDIGGLVHLVVELFIVGLILWLLWWLIDYFGLPQPFNKVAKCIIALMGVLFLVNILLSLL